MSIWISPYWGLVECRIPDPAAFMIPLYFVPFNTWFYIFFIGEFLSFWQILWSSCCYGLFFTMAHDMLLNTARGRFRTFYFFGFHGSCIYIISISIGLWNCVNDGTPAFSIFSIFIPFYCFFPNYFVLLLSIGFRPSYCVYILYVLTEAYDW